jgi:hypothetical protein
MSNYFKDDLLNENQKGNENIITRVYNYLQAFNDKVQFFKKERWIVVGLLVVFYLIRLIITGGTIY